MHGAMYLPCSVAKQPSLEQEILKGKNHCTIDLLFDWFGISCMTTDNFCFYLQNRLIQTNQTRGQWYSDTSHFSIPWLELKTRPLQLLSSLPSNIKLQPSAIKQLAKNETKLLHVLLHVIDASVE
jgi:hypothetical protein